MQPCHTEQKQWQQHHSHPHCSVSFVRLLLGEEPCHMKTDSPGKSAPCNIQREGEGPGTRRADKAARAWGPLPTPATQAQRPVRVRQEAHAPSTHRTRKRVWYVRVVRPPSAKVTRTPAQGSHAGLEQKGCCAVHMRYHSLNKAMAKIVATRRSNGLATR